MKKILLLLLTIATIALSSFGQAPEGFKYQAVIRDAGNVILNNQTVGLRMTLQQGAIGGTAVYTETFSTTSNAFGLVNLEIGNGTSTDDFTTIDWANGPYFMETAIDITGGTSYIVMGTSQLMSVPYALYAKTSGNGQGPVGPTGADGTQGIQGIAGNDGVDGLSAYEVWLGLGNVGTETDFINSLTGPQGIQGDPGPVGSSVYADFYALMPGDNAAVVAVGAAVEFPQDGPMLGGINRLSPSDFVIADPGVYKVHFTVSVNEAGQLGLAVNGALVSYTVSGRATGTSQITGDFLIVLNSFDILSLINPSGNSTALSITPVAGGTHQVSAHLLITKL